ncbi:MAG: hypothetical protein WCJ18_12315, partial [Planctomycetota bacterium]
MTAMNDQPHDESTADEAPLLPAAAAEHPAAQAPVAPDLDDDDDGTPAELDDPFAGGEDAKPVATSADDEAPPVGDKQWYILKVQS